MRDQLRHAEASRIATCGPDKFGVDPYTDWHAKLIRMSGAGD